MFHSAYLGLLCMMVFVTITLAGFASSVQVAAVSRWLNDAVAREAVKLGSLLMGESVQPGW